MTSCEVFLHIWRWCYNMLCKKLSAIIIINNKWSKLLLQNLLRLHSGPSFKRSTPAPLLFSKIVKTPAGVHSDTPASVHLCWLLFTCAGFCSPLLASVHLCWLLFTSAGFCSPLLASDWQKWALQSWGGRSHFFRLRSCSKIFESGSGNFSNLRIRLLFRLRIQSSIQA